MSLVFYRIITLTYQSVYVLVFIYCLLNILFFIYLKFLPEFVFTTEINGKRAAITHERLLKFRVITKLLMGGLRRADDCSFSINEKVHRFYGSTPSRRECVLLLPSGSI